MRIFSSLTDSLLINKSYLEQYLNFLHSLSLHMIFIYFRKIPGCWSSWEYYILSFLKIFLLRVQLTIYLIWSCNMTNSQCGRILFNTEFGFNLVFLLSEICFPLWQNSLHQPTAQSLHGSQKILWSPVTCDVTLSVLSYTLYFLSKQDQLNLGFISSIHQMYIIWRMSY